MEAAWLLLREQQQQQQQYQRWGGWGPRVASPLLFSPTSPPPAATPATLVPDLARRLRRVATLDAHEGCVNRLKWSPDGSLLASVSDDLHVCLWDVQAQEAAAAAFRSPPGDARGGPLAPPLAKWRTDHRANLFGVAFLPSGGGAAKPHLLATGSMDGTVQLHDLNRLPVTTPGAPAPPMRLDAAARGRVKDVTAEPEGGSPHLFFTAAEDGAIRQYDCRTWGQRSGATDAASRSAARAQDVTARNVIVQVDPRSRPRPAPSALRATAPAPRNPSHRGSISLGGWRARRLKAVAVCPTRPHLLAVGCGDASARLYDRRMLARPARFASPSAGTGAGGGAGGGGGAAATGGTPELAVLAPPHLSAPGRPGNAVHCTHVSFSPQGDRLLVNYSGEAAYCFDVSGASGAVGDVQRRYSSSLLGGGGGDGREEGEEGPSAAAPSNNNTTTTTPLAPLFVCVPRQCPPWPPVATPRRAVVAVACDRVLDCHEASLFPAAATTALRNAFEMLLQIPLAREGAFCPLAERYLSRHDQARRISGASTRRRLRAAIVWEVEAAVRAAPWSASLRALRAALLRVRAWPGDEAEVVADAEWALWRRKQQRAELLPRGFLEALGRGGGPEGAAAAAAALVSRCVDKGCGGGSGGSGNDAPAADVALRRRLAAAVEAAASRVAAWGSAKAWRSQLRAFASTETLAHRLRSAGYGACGLMRSRRAALAAARSRLGSEADTLLSLVSGSHGNPGQLADDVYGGGLWSVGGLSHQDQAELGVWMERLLGVWRERRSVESVGLEDAAFFAHDAERVWRGSTRYPQHSRAAQAARDAGPKFDPQWRGWSKGSGAAAGNAAAAGDGDDDDDEEEEKERSRHGAGNGDSGDEGGPGWARGAWDRDDFFGDEGEVGEGGGEGSSSAGGTTTTGSGSSEEAEDEDEEQAEARRRRQQQRRERRERRQRRRELRREEERRRRQREAAAEAAAAAQGGSGVSDGADDDDEQGDDGEESEADHDDQQHLPSPPPPFSRRQWRAKLRRLSRRGGPLDAFVDDARLADTIYARAWALRANERRSIASIDEGGGGGAAAAGAQDDDNDDPRCFVGAASAAALPGGTCLLQRYVGAANLKTDIKECTFVGARGEVVAAGSDDGRFFLFDAASSALLAAAEADEDIVNIVQASPASGGACLIATSGIESVVRLWSPVGCSPTGALGALNLPPAEAAALERAEAREARARQQRLRHQTDRLNDGLSLAFDRMDPRERDDRLRAGQGLEHEAGVGRVRPAGWRRGGGGGAEGGGGGGGGGDERKEDDDDGQVLRAAKLARRAAATSSSGNSDSGSSEDDNDDDAPAREQAAPSPPLPEEEQEGLDDDPQDPYTGAWPHPSTLSLLPGITGAALEVAAERNAEAMTQAAVAPAPFGLFDFFDEEEEEEDDEEDDEEDEDEDEEEGEEGAGRGRGRRTEVMNIHQLMNAIPPGQRAEVLRALLSGEHAGAGGGGGGAGSGGGGGGGDAPRPPECRTM